MPEILSEQQQLILLGQSLWAYILDNSQVLLVQGEAYLCSVLPGTEQAVCSPIELQGKDI